MNNVRSGQVSFEGCTYLSPRDYERVLKRYKPRRGDVLLVCVGATIGRAGVVGKEERFSTDRSLAVVRFDKSKVLPQFGFAVIRSRFVQRQILAYSIGSAQPHLYLGDIRRITIPVPPIANQTAALEVVQRINEAELWIGQRHDVQAQLRNGLLKSAMEGTTS